MRHRTLLLSLGLAACTLPLLHGAAAAADPLEVSVRITNRTASAKSDWPVFLPICKLFGGNLPMERLAAGGFRVLDAAGADVPHMLRRMPPAFSIGDDEIVLRIAKMAAGESHSFRIVLADRPGAAAEFDLVGNPNNLLDLAALATASSGGGATVERCQEAGRPALRLTLPVGGRMVLRGGPVAIARATPYYCSFRARCENLAYNGWGFWGCGGSARFEPAALAGRYEIPLRGDRDWFCYRFDSGPDDMAARSLPETVRGRGGERTAQIWQQGGRTAFTLAAFQQDQPILSGQKTGRLWLAEPLLFEQPEVAVDRSAAWAAFAGRPAMLFVRPVNMGVYRPVAPHEAADRLDAFAMRGERRQVRFGVHALQPLADVRVRVGGLDGPGGPLPVGRLELERLGEYVEPAAVIAQLPAGRSAEFLLAIDVPADAAPGAYRGTISFSAAGKPLGELPLTLDVLPLAAPAMDGWWVGGIFNEGFGVQRTDAFYRCYGRLRFNYLLLFDYLTTAKKGSALTLDAADAEVRRIRELARVAGGIGLYREPNLSDDQPRKWLQIAAGRPDFAGPYKLGIDAKWKPGYQRLARETDAYARAHRWPTLLYMVTDEPDKPADVDGSLGWLNDALPAAITIADTQFADMLKTWRWFNTPILDDPIDWTGPLVYRFVRSQKQRFGICGKAQVSAEVGRYQTGLMLASSGARYFHFWHLARVMRERDGRVERSHSLAAMAEGFTDLRYYAALRAAIERAGNTPRRPVAAEAEAMLAEVFAFATADHDQHVLPYNGVPALWGDDRWYDRWRERMKDLLLRLAEPHGQ